MYDDHAARRHTYLTTVWRECARIVERWRDGTAIAQAGRGCIYYSLGGTVAGALYSTIALRH